MSVEKSPILNNPYEEPLYHYATIATGDEKGALDYTKIINGRRIFSPDLGGNSIPLGKKSQQENLFEVNDFAPEYGEHLINLIRKEVGQWRKEAYPNTTRVTKELLTFWFLNPERSNSKRLFFAQREAVETAIWLNEVAEKSNAGTNILNKLKERQYVSANLDYNLPRVAFKMATGSGKTVVMATLILYHYFNRQEYRNDDRFCDNFLIVAPGITIKDRLGVLFVDTSTRDPQKINDYYRQRGLVPFVFEDKLEALNAKLVITNYHSFEPKILQGNKRSPFDGKIQADGSKKEAKEDFNQVVKRLLGKFKRGSRLLVLNDEAHHCYLPREKGKRGEDGDNTVEENQRAAVWFNGLAELAKRFQVRHIYDLSATPYYLNGSGYPAYSLFGWVVTDFGLIEAIESGLVKIPFLPESDTSQELTMPMLRNLYEHIRDLLPKKGQNTQKKEAKEAGKKVVEQPANLPPLLIAALDQFYKHYEEDFHRTGFTKLGTMYDSPPVFILVCNNTSVSKEVYKYLAGFQAKDENGEVVQTYAGKYDLFNNFDQYDRPLSKPPTLLIDSDALENSEQIDDEFKKIFAPEIDKFKVEYARIHGQGAAERLTDAEILREVVNTVGKQGALGSHIRCVVSVSMLTEGWDANTVTHIAGVRAFGSQLLCEQVAGRALRRKSYNLQPYDRDGNPIESRNLNRYKEENIIWKFPPEYAHIIGVPFKLFKGGSSEPPPKPEYTQIYALPERQAKHEITFPNLIGYRVEVPEGLISADFSKIPHFEIDYTALPVQTIMGTAFSADKQELNFSSVYDLRDQEVIFKITKDLIRFYYSDDDGRPYFQKFGQLKRIVEEWYTSRVALAGETRQEFKRILYFWEPKILCDQIMQGIYAEQKGKDLILPIFNHYNRFGSTKYVSGQTTKEVYETQKSHVNYVVADTDAWEQIAAKTLEELPEVVTYVKNAFLGFSIPYVAEGKDDKRYFPDFIAKIQTESGQTANLIIEVTGMNRDKFDKKFFVENRWLPAVNAVREKYQMDEWYFIEIANDIRYIKNQLMEKIQQMNQRLMKLQRLRQSFGTIKTGIPLTSEQLRREHIYNDEK